MLVIGGEDLRPGLQLQALSHKGHGLGRIPGKDQPFRVHTQESPQGTLQIIPIHPRGIGGGHPTGMLRHSIHHHGG